MATQSHTDGGDVSDEIEKITRVHSQLTEQRYVIERMRAGRETTVRHAGGDPVKDAAHSDLQLARDQIDDTVNKLIELMHCIAASGDLDDYTRTGRR
jgi:division protein CdvB (Snf7/Vps24/ESCRT-III family)